MSEVKLYEAAVDYQGDNEVPVAVVTERDADTAGDRYILIETNLKGEQEQVSLTIEEWNKDGVYLTREEAQEHADKGLRFSLERNIPQAREKITHHKVKAVDAEARLTYLLNRWEQVYPGEEPPTCKEVEHTASVDPDRLSDEARKTYEGMAKHRTE